MGVEVADNHALDLEVLNPAEQIRQISDVTVADQTCFDIADMENLMPCRQETDGVENLEVHENIKHSHFSMLSADAYKLPGKCISQGIRGEEMHIEHTTDLLRQSFESKRDAYRQEAMATVEPHALATVPVWGPTGQVEGFRGDRVLLELLEGVKTLMPINVKKEDPHAGSARSDRSHVILDCERDPSILAKGVSCTTAPSETPQTTRGDCSSHDLIPKSDKIFGEGEKVAYWSDTHMQWMAALVKRVVFEQSTGPLVMRVRCYDLDVKTNANPAKVKALPEEEAVTNDEEPCAAEAVRSVELEGQCAELEAVNAVLACETNSWPREPAANQEGATAVGFVVGESVQYWSDSHQKWALAVVEEVSSDGATYDLDVKKGALTERIQRLPTVTAVEKGASMSGPSGQPVEPVPVAFPVGLSSYLSSKSPISGKPRSSCSALPVSQYAHRPVSTTSMAEQLAEQLPQRGTSPISGRRRVCSLDQPLVDVGSSKRVGAKGPNRRGASQKRSVICGAQATNVNASPVLSSRFGMGDVTGARARSPSLGSARAADERMVSRQSSHAGGAEKSANQLSSASSNVLLSYVRPIESTTVMRTGGNLNPILGAASATCFVSTTTTTTTTTAGNTVTTTTTTPAETPASRVRSRSRSVGRNCLIPKRISQDSAATPMPFSYCQDSAATPMPAVCTVQAQGFATQFSSFRPTTGPATIGSATLGSATTSSGAAHRGTVSYSGVPSQLLFEDLAVGDGSFDPSHPAVRSQLIAKLHLQGDVRCEEMTGFRGGLNEGVWFLNANGVSLVLKLVRGKRQHDIPTEAESFVKLSQEHPGIAGDMSITFPIKIFKCMRRDATKVLDLIVMRKAPGMRLAEITAHMYHGKQVDSIMPIYERVGKLLREFHTRYGNSQHNDFQPSNVLYCEETGAITMIDVGGMGRDQGMESDCQHFRKSMESLGGSYPGLVAPCLRHFQLGYEHSLSHR